MLKTDHDERPLITKDNFGVNVNIKLMLVENGDMKLMIVHLPLGNIGELACSICTRYYDQVHQDDKYR